MILIFMIDVRKLYKNKPEKHITLENIISSKS